MNDEPARLHRSVVDALAAADMRAAIVACRELNTRFPRFFPGWLVAGEIHRRMNKPEAGLVAADRALELQPGDPRVLLQKLNCLLALGRVAQAQDDLDKLLGAALDSAELLDQAGRMCAMLERHEDALEQYRRALALAPDNAALWYNLASEQRFLGQISAAEESLDEALRRQPLDFEAQAMRSSLRKATAGDNHVEELERVLNDPALPEPGKVSIQFALARELDDLGQYAAAFAALKSGADLRRRHLGYKVDDDLALIEAIQHQFDLTFMSRETPGSANREPIFILGMPRTGTTLVERILGSHSDVFAAGELDTFGRQLMTLIQAAGTDDVSHGAERVRLAAGVDFQSLGEAYVQATRPATGHTPRFIDKLPFNFLYAGLIHKALPNAHIINLVRHPMATCYAVYKQLFRDAYPFSYSLEDLGRYYVAYVRLMQHWEQVMPGVIHKVSYEALVEDTPGQSRALLDACGLEWQDACLAFYDNPQASTTASASQVRRPVYRDSLQHWLHYREQLAPLEKYLNAQGIATDALA